MKKNLCKLIATMLAILMVSSVFVVMPAMAATAKSYDISATTETITVDGNANEAIWSKVDSSDNFVNVNGTTINGFAASYKAVWSPCEDDQSKMNVYIFITATGYAIENNYRNYIRIQIENQDGTHRFWSGMQQLNNIKTGSADRTATVGTEAVAFKLFAVNDIANTKTATYEFCYTMPKSDTVKLDIIASACTSSYGEAKYAWVNMTNTPTASADLAGVGNIIPMPSIPTYDITRTAEDITIDGKANESVWSDISDSSAFVNVSGNKIDGFTANYKAVWKPNAEDQTKMDVYIFIAASGYTVQYSWRNNIRIQIETPDASHRFWSGQQQLGNISTGSADRTCAIGSETVPFKLFAVNNIGNSKSATYEFCYTMPKSDTIKLDILVNAKKSSSEDVDATYSWVEMLSSGVNYTPTGIGNIKGFDFSNVAIVTTAGASIRIDTANKSKSGIRFETKVDANAVNALISKGAKITTGTLVLPTDFLAAKSIADEDFTIEGLNAAGLVEGTHYYNIVNENNEWVEGSDGAWYGTLYDIKNFTREFSGVGYITIEIYGETVTYYGGYAIDNARSIAGVAETLMDGEVAGDDGNWTAAQEEVLLGFYKAEA